MKTEQGVSRRDMLAMAAAGGMAIAGVRGAAAQAAKRIERLAPELDAIIATSEPILELAGGVGGDNGPAEGPVWWKEGGYLLFSDINGNRRHEIHARTGMVEFKKPTNRAKASSATCRGGCLPARADGRPVIRED